MGKNETKYKTLSLLHMSTKYSFFNMVLKVICAAVWYGSVPYSTHIWWWLYHMNDSDWFVALKSVFLCHILFYMRLNGSYNCSYTGSYVVALHQKSYIRNTRYNHSDLFRRWPIRIAHFFWSEDKVIYLTIIE